MRRTGTARRRQQQGKPRSCVVCHVYMLPRCHHQQEDKRGTRGGKDKGQKEDSRWLAAAARLVSTRGQQEDREDRQNTTKKGQGLETG